MSVKRNFFVYNQKKDAIFARMPFARILILLATSYIFIQNISIAQEGNSLQGFGVEANLLIGKVVKHEKKFTAPIPPITTALDVNLVWQTYGKKDWQQRRNFPVIGVGITYTDYGLNKVFGNCLGIYPNIQVPLVRGKDMELTLRIGDGLAYVSRKYQTVAPVDTLNTAIGSHVDDFAIFMLDWRAHLDQHWNFQLGANFTHISNADYHQPNLGVNVAGIHAGLQYFPVSNKTKYVIKPRPTLSNRWLIEGRYGMAFKEARAPYFGNPIEPTYLGTAYASKRWWSKNKFYTGMDYAYHKDVYQFLINYGVDYKHEKAHAWDGTCFAGNEFLEGRVGFVTQLGVYYHQTFLKFDPVCEKIGVNFYLIQQEHGSIKELFLSAMLLTHEIVAEYAEFGIGAGF